MAGRIVPAAVLRSPPRSGPAGGPPGPACGRVELIPLEAALPGVLSRAERTGRPFALALLRPGVVGRRGRLVPPADPAALGLLAATVSVQLRPTQVLYGAGDDRLAVVVPGPDRGEVGRLMRRTVEGGAPAFSWAGARWPVDGATAGTLLKTAARRLEGADPSVAPSAERVRPGLEVARGAVAAAAAAVLAVLATLFALDGSDGPSAPSFPPAVPAPASVPASVPALTTATAPAAPSGSDAGGTGGGTSTGGQGR